MNLDTNKYFILDLSLFPLNMLLDTSLHSNCVRDRINYRLHIFIKRIYKVIRLIWLSCVVFFFFYRTVLFSFLRFLLPHIWLIFYYYACILLSTRREWWLFKNLPKHIYDNKKLVQLIFINIQKSCNYHVFLASNSPNIY